MMECGITNLPQSILLKIFSYVSRTELCKYVRKVCKLWNTLSYDYSFWKHTDVSEFSAVVTTWKKFIEAFGRVSDQIEVLDLTNCKHLLDSDEAILWECLKKDADSDIGTQEYLSQEIETDPDSNDPVLTFRKLNKIIFHYCKVDLQFVQMLCILVDGFPSLHTVEIFPFENYLSLINIFQSSAQRKGKWKEFYFGEAVLADKTDVDFELKKSASILNFTLSNSNSLTDLSLTRISIDDAQFIEICKTCTSLERILISGCHKISDDIEIVAPYLKRLKHLDISGTNIGDRALTEISKHSVLLQKVVAHDCGKLTDSGIKSLVQNAHGLEDLFLSSNITDSGLEDIGAFASTLKSLTVDDEANISDIGICSVAKGCPQLQHLDISRCISITDLAVTTLSQHCPNLKSLRAPGCTHLTSVSINSLVLSCSKLSLLYLATCHYLKGLNFDSSTLANGYGEINIDSEVQETNNTAEENMKIHHEAQITTNSVTSLSCTADSSGASYTSLLHELLASTPCRLTVLDVSCCSYIANDSIKQIAKHCQLLRYLDMRGCYSVTDSGIEALVTGCKLLQALNIKGSNLIKRSTLSNESLYAIARRCRNLVMLDIMKNPLMNIDGVERLICGCGTLRRLQVSCNIVNLGDVVLKMKQFRGSVSVTGCNAQAILSSGQSDFNGDAMLNFPPLPNSVAIFP